jgi:hypothetical protein
MEQFDQIPNRTVSVEFSNSTDAVKFSNSTDAAKLLNSTDEDDLMGFIKYNDSSTWGILGGTSSGDMDEKTSIKQLHSGRRNKSSIDGFSMNTQKYNFARLYDKELRENEDKVWYSHEATSDDVIYPPAI